ELLWSRGGRDCRHKLLMSKSSFLPSIFNAAIGLPAKPHDRRFSAVAHAVHQYLILAAVDLDHRTVDEERKIGGEISDEIGDFVAFGDAAERDACRRELVGVLKLWFLCP